MTNEFFFIAHALTIGIFAVLALSIGKEALIALLCTQAILSNLFVTKQIIILGLCATCSDVFSVGSSLSLNLLQEYYGKKIAQKTIWISFFMLIFYLFMTQFHLLYLPSKFDTTQSHFYCVLNLAPRLVIASLISYLISQQIDTYSYAYFRNKFADKFFILRNYSSLIISQFVDTVIFTIIGLYGVIDNLIEIFIISYFVKLITVLLATPVIALSKKYIKLRFYVI